MRDDDGLCSHCGAPLYPSERCDCWERARQRVDTPLERLRWERGNNSFARTATITDDTLDLVEEALERASPQGRVIMASVRLGSWMSAALDDPKVCEEMKADIREWFSAGEPRPGWNSPSLLAEIDRLNQEVLG